MRKIIHLDMDCFYAAVEMRDHPFLRGKAIAVGGSSRRGVLTTCSYEARKFGCRSAMPAYKALELCPELIIVPTRFDVYRAESHKIRAIMRDYSELVEPLSLDEAFIDVSSQDRYAWDIAKEMRERIFRETGLTASAGIAANKLLAKIASDWRKPNGQFAIRPEDVASFMPTLPVSRLWGVGPKSTAKLATLGIETCADVLKAGPERMVELVGNWGRDIYVQAQGIDDRPVSTDRVRKSLSNERTFDDLLTTLQECDDRLEGLYHELQSDLKRSAQDRKIAKLLVRLKFDDFEKTSRECVSQTVELSQLRRLLAEAWERRQGRAVRLMGVGVRLKEPSDLPEQLELDFKGGGPVSK